MSIKGLPFYLFLSAIISILIINSKAYILLIIQLVIFIVVFKKHGTREFWITIAIFVLFLVYRPNEKPMLFQTYVEQDYQVIETKEKYMIVSSEKVNYLVYYIDNQQFNTNDKVKIKGTIKEIEKDLDADVFEFKDYLKNKRVFYEIESYEIKIKKKGFSLSANIISFLTSKLVNESYNMTKMLLFNDKYADIDIYNNLIEISAVHLFVVSGFHISFFFTLITKLIKNKKAGSIVGFAICIFYVFLLDFSISASRALISLIISKTLKEHFNRLDYIAIPGLLFLLIEPLNLYNYSFIMSYLMVTVITISSTFLENKPKIIQTLVVSFFCFLSIIPIQLIMNYKINFISLITNILLSYVVIAIFVLCLLGMILSFINGDIFSKVYEVFNDTIEKISSLNTSLIFGSMNEWMIALYYGILILIIISLEKKWKIRSVFSFIAIITFMILLYNRHIFLFYQQVTFLNVYQGDCIIIQDSYNGKVMLIDTGGLTYYDIASKKIIPYLEYHGIKKIDVVVITHEDYDHCGALESLSEQIKIGVVISDPYVEEVNVGKLSFKNLNKYFEEDDSENNKSIVLYGNICSYDFLFTGDISQKIELQLYEYIYQLNVDVLKVAHHGSNTSSCDTFIEFVSPKYAVISVGENNFYGHPAENVLETLKKYGVEIYRTDLDGTIKIKGKIFDKCFIDTAK